MIIFSLQVLLGIFFKVQSVALTEDVPHVNNKGYDGTAVYDITLFSLGLSPGWIFPFALEWFSSCSFGENKRPYCSSIVFIQALLHTISIKSSLGVCHKTKLSYEFPTCRIVQIKQYNTVIPSTNNQVIPCDTFTLDFAYIQNPSWP